MQPTTIRSWSTLLKQGVLSRRRLLQAAAGTAGGLVGAGLLAPTKARAQDDCIAPKPIPATLPADLIAPGSPPFPIHEFIGLADQAGEASNITDFFGEIGNAQGGGSGTDNQGNSLLISVAALRFMKGVYVGVDGKFHWGAFAFI
jgi:hypothetical protein